MGGSAASTADAEGPSWGVGPRAALRATLLLSFSSNFYMPSLDNMYLHFHLLGNLFNF